MANDVCVLLVGEGAATWGVAGVTDYATAEAWRLADGTHRAFMLFELGNIDDEFRPLPDASCTVIESFLPAEGCAPVRVIIDGEDDWDRRKAYELIKASVHLYHALCDATEHLAHVDPNWANLENLERTQAEACGAVLQSDLLVARKPGKSRQAKNT
jgi:hypothetical protein